MSRKTLITAALLLGSVLSAGVFAQAGGGWGGNGGHGRKYDSNTVETVKGTIESVAMVEKGKGHGVHATLKTDQGTIEVDLGPSFYVDAQPVKISAGDAVTVTGSKIARGDRSVIIAAEVTKGGEALKLRNASTGVPLWSRGGGQGR